MRQGLAFAFAYNVLLIPVAAGALYAFDELLLDPVLASAAMAMSSVSVLTNALRLRRFRRPATVHEIEHPPVRQRLGQYAYLTGIAVVALAIGTALTAVSRMDFAERGMNGTLAWMQTTGMPMRPAMSVMMTAEIDPAPPTTPAWTSSSTCPTAPGRASRPGSPPPSSTPGPASRSRTSPAATRRGCTSSPPATTSAPSRHVHPSRPARAGELAGRRQPSPPAGRYIVNTESASRDR
jgi:Cu+-exporting ATPase